MQGVFREELKNRFLCSVEVDGALVLCYIPSSCRLSNFVDLVGKKVLLTPVLSSKSRTKYSVYALCVGKRFILLNLSKANDVIRSYIDNRRFSMLGKRTSIRREYNVGGYKADLFIEDTKTVIEIKSILSFSKNHKATFPSIYSQRAIEQLTKIKTILEHGYRVCYIFVSLNPAIKILDINDTYLEYRSLFEECLKKGMVVKGVSINLVNGHPKIYSSISINM